MADKGFISTVYGHWVSAWGGTLSLVISLFLKLAGKSDLSVIGWLLFGVICFFIASYQAWKGERDEVTTLNAKLEARPSIRLAQTDPYNILMVTITYATVPFPETPFLRLRLVNAPLHPSPSAVAKQVRANITFYDFTDGGQLLEVKGRWAETTQPSGIPPLHSQSHLLAVDFGIGEEHLLDVAYIPPQDKKTCSAWNNENYSYPGSLKPEHVLRGDVFRVKVHLLGEWVDNVFWFNFCLTPDSKLAVFATKQRHGETPAGQALEEEVIRHDAQAERN